MRESERWGRVEEYAEMGLRRNQLSDWSENILSKDTIPAQHHDWQTVAEMFQVMDQLLSNW